MSARASLASVAGLHETAITSGTFDFAIRSACSAAPARGGSKTTASNALSSRAESGSRKRSRTTAVTGFSPCAWRTARESAAIARRSLS